MTLRYTKDGMLILDKKLRRMEANGRRRQRRLFSQKAAGNARIVRAGRPCKAVPEKTVRFFWDLYEGVGAREAMEILRTHKHGVWSRNTLMRAAARLGLCPKRACEYKRKVAA